MAQSVERRLGKAEVTGPIPVSSFFYYPEIPLYGLSGFLHKKGVKHMSNKVKVYIDGSEGTTGLRIFERFQDRDDGEIIKINPELRKDPAERKKLINASDVTFLCLPDATAARVRTFCR